MKVLKKGNIRRVWGGYVSIKYWAIPPLLPSIPYPSHYRLPLCSALCFVSPLRQSDSLHTLSPTFWRRIRSFHLLRITSDQAQVNHTLMACFVALLWINCVLCSFYYFSGRTELGLRNRRENESRGSEISFEHSGGNTDAPH